MARNSSGIYTLPVAAFVSGATIKSADMNSNLSDISTALTQSLATTGVSPMTGPIKCADGSLAAPSLTLASDITTGWYKSGAGTWTYVGSGTSIATFAPSGVSIGNLSVVNLTVTGAFTVASARIVGEVVDYCGTSAPALFLLAFGQAISRITYAALFGVIGTNFGAGDGVTTFNVPDYRGRVGVGKDDMGGVAANRITNAECGIVGTTLGASGGVQSVTLTSAQMPIHTHTVNDPTHAHADYASTGVTVSPAGATPVLTSLASTPSSSNANTGAASTGITLGNAGSGNSHSNQPPSLIVNKIIYTAV